MLAGALGAGMLLLSGKRATAKNLGIKLEKVPALQKVGGSAKLKLEGQEILFIRDSDTSVRALSALCTHQECPVTYDSKKGKIECSCHGSFFDLNGNATKGPAKKPLRAYPATLKDGSIVVTVD
jgi:Rieske Fe-S protein